MSDLLVTIDYESPEYWYFERNAQGTLESTNVMTGEVRASEIPLSELHKYELVVKDGRRYWVPSSMAPAMVPGFRVKEYTPFLAEELCSYIVSGSGINKACNLLGISYHCFSKWKRLHEEFAIMVESAIKDRAFFLFEETLVIAENTLADRDEVALAKLKTEIYKSASAIGDDRFNPKQRIEADHRIGVVSVETGIRRGPSAQEAEVSTGVTSVLSPSIHEEAKVEVNE